MMTLLQRTALLFTGLTLALSQSSAAEPGNKIILTKPVLSLVSVAGRAPMSNFQLVCERFKNNSTKIMNTFKVNIYSSGVKYAGTGKVDGVFLGSADVKGYLLPTLGFDNLKLSIPIDIAKAKQIQALKGQPQVIVLTVSALLEGTTKIYLYGYVNFPKKDFTTNKWVTP